MTRRIHSLFVALAILLTSSITVSAQSGGGRTNAPALGNQASGASSVGQSGTGGVYYGYGQGTYGGYGQGYNIYGPQHYANAQPRYANGLNYYENGQPYSANDQATYNGYGQVSNNSGQSFVIDNGRGGNNYSGYGYGPYGNSFGNAYQAPVYSSYGYGSNNYYNQYGGQSYNENARVNPFSRF